jgi:Tol biopolymer transport system component
MTTQFRSLAPVAAVALLLACNDDVVLPTPRPTLSIEKATPSGDLQTDTVLATLDSPLRVLVLLGTEPAPGITVSWKVSPDTASPIPATITDGTGIASFRRTLGRFVGTYTVQASVIGAKGSPLTFTATAVAARPRSLGMVSGDGQFDTLKARLGADYVVRVNDSYGNGVGGIAVDWAVTAGGGSITPTRSTTQTSSGLAAARHTLGPDPGPQTVTATASALAGVAPVTFAALTAGVVQVTTTTTGVAFDPDGYQVNAHATSGDNSAAVPVNGTTTMSRVRPGDYTVTLSGVAVNCDVTQPDSRALTVPSGGTVSVAFAVACGALTQLAFASTARGSLDVYTVNSNGTVITQLTTNAASDGDPAWSADGNKIAFASWRDGNSEIYAMGADGSGVKRLTDTTAADWHPTWSPDGKRIAFVSDRSGRAEIFVMQADGSGPVLLTNLAGGHDPAWSPDGNKLAFVSERQGPSSIYVMNPDGSGVSRLTSGQTDGEPAWSPDGTKLAFTRYASCDYYSCDRDLYVMNADGTGATSVTSGYEDDSHPTWSPDGRWIAFTEAVCDYYYGCYDASIKAVKAGGTRVEDISGFGFSPAWRP